MATNTWDSVDDYFGERLLGADPILDAVLDASRAGGLPEIAVAPNQGALLNILARAVGAKRILEVGTLGGYSTIWLARALPKDGKLITLEVEQHHADVAQKNIAHAGLGAIVDIRIGKAIDFLPKIAAEGIGPFDMIFIDADKPPYVEYFQWALKLSRPGTLIVADNVIRDGKVLDPDCTDPMVKGAQRFNQMLSSNT